MLERRMNTVFILLALNIWDILKGLDSNCNRSLKEKITLSNALK